MLKLQIIGNLGSDAEVLKEQGSQFVKLSIAHTEKRKSEDGHEREVTTWVSATINGDGGNLMPYLKKGTRVYAYGDIALRVFHSEKERRMMAGINLFIRNIELLGGSSDNVPRDLYDIDGVAHRVGKYYYVADVRNQPLYDRSAAEYLVDASGWVTKLQPEGAADAGETQSQVDNSSTGANSDANAATTDAQEEKTTKAKSKKS